MGVIPTPLDHADRAGWLLVGTVHAPSRGFPHHRLRRPSPGPGVLRGHHGRQHAHRSPRRDQGISTARSDPTPRASSPPGWSPEAPRSPSTRSTSIHGSEPPKEGRALRIETVVDSPTDWACQRASTTSPSSTRGPGGQPTPARAPARRSGLCHRDRSVGADLTALARGGPKNRGIALRGSTCHGPGRCTLVALNTVVGFTNKSLRALVSQLLDGPYSTHR